MEKGDGTNLTSRINAIVFFMVALIPFSNAQKSNENYPVQFNQFAFSYPLVNPSSIGVNHDNEVIVGYQKPVSGFTGLATYYCTVSFAPYRVRDGALNRNIIGFRFVNDVEGAYISRTRFYGMYAFHTQLTSSLRFSGGIDFGGMNFSVKATPTTEGASVFKLDASTGIWLYNDNFHIGLSINQLFRSVFQPIDEKTVLPTHFNATASYVIFSGDQLVIRPHILITLPYYKEASIRASLYGLIFDKVITVLGYDHRKSFSVMLGVNEMKIYGSTLGIILSYNTTLRKAALGINKLEVSMNYSF